MGPIRVTSPNPADKRAREDSRLVALARHGDTGAFDQLVRRYRERIFALALHITGSASDADDITQDVFMRAFSQIRDFQGRSAFFTWLYRIALNRAFNVRRDERRRRAIRLTDDRVRMAVAVDARGDPRRQLELRETYGLLVQALDRLSPLLRATVVLTALQGFNYKEAAVVLETTESTVAWRVHEARTQLRRTIEKLTKDPTPLPRHKRIRVVAELRGFLSSLRLDSAYPDPIQG